MEQLRGTSRPAAGEGPTDGELLERFVHERDDAAFTELVRRHGPMVHGVCRRLLIHAEDVEDAFQATFMVLVRKADSIRKRDSAASWLYGVALRVARRARVALGRRREREQRAARPEAITPDEAWHELRPALDATVALLPEKYRVLVVLCYMEGKTYEEAARLLALAKGTVSTRLSQAREMLRRQLKRRGIALSLALLAALLEHNAAPAAVPARLPARALDAAHSAAGHGGAASPGAAELANYVLRGQALLKPVSVAVLAFVLLLGGVGVFVWHKWGPSWARLGNAPIQAWEQRETLEGHGSIAWRMRFSPDGRLLVTQAGSLDMAIHVWNTETWKEEIKPIRADDGSFQMFVAFTPDSRSILTMPVDFQIPNQPAQGDGTIRLWDVESGKERMRFPGGGAAILAPDGKSLAVIRQNHSVHAIDLPSGRDRALPEVPLQPANTLAFSPDSKLLAVGSTADAIILYDTSTWQERDRLAGNALPTLDLAFSPDGSMLASLHGGLPNVEPSVRDVKVWRVGAKKRFTLARHEATLLAYTPDGAALVTLDRNGVFHFWDPADGTPRHEFGSGQPVSRPLRLVFSPDGKSIVAPLTDGSVQIRDTATGQVLATLAGRRWPVVDAAFSRDGQMLVTGEMINRQLVGAKGAQAIVWERLR
jgi:RNA polymerase sigma factor (sigma-70 family)